MTTPHTQSQLEAGLEAYFMRKVRGVGGHTWKLAPTEKGVPDRAVLLPGRLLLVELKIENGRVSPAQKHWHERAARLGTHVFVIWGREGVDAWVRSQVRIHAKELAPAEAVDRNRMEQARVEAAFKELERRADAARTARPSSRSVEDKLADLSALAV